MQPISQTLNCDPYTLTVSVSVSVSVSSFAEFAGVIITALDSFLLLLIDRLGVRHLEAMFGVLVGVMAIAFGIMFADAGVNIGQVLEGGCKSHIYVAFLEVS